MPSVLRWGWNGYLALLELREMIFLCTKVVVDAYLIRVGEKAAA